MHHLLYKLRKNHEILLTGEKLIIILISSLRTRQKIATSSSNSCKNRIWKKFYSCKSNFFSPSSSCHTLFLWFRETVLICVHQFFLRSVRVDIPDVQVFLFSNYAAIFPSKHAMGWNWLCQQNHKITVTI